MNKQKGKFLKRHSYGTEEKKVSLRPFLNRVFKFLNKEYLSGITIGFILHAGISGELIPVSEENKSDALHSHMTSKDFSPTQKAQFLIRALIDCPESDVFTSLIHVTQKNYMRQMDELLADNMIDMPKAVETMGHVLYGRSVSPETVKKTLLEGIEGLKFDMANSDISNFDPQELERYKIKMKQLELLQDLFQKGVQTAQNNNIHAIPLAKKIFSSDRERE